MKKTIVISSIAALVVLSGCGGASSGDKGGLAPVDGTVSSSSGGNSSSTGGAVSSAAGEAVDKTFILDEKTAMQTQSLTQGERYRAVRDYLWTGKFKVIGSAGKVCRLDLLSFEQEPNTLNIDYKGFSWSGTLTNVRWIDATSGISVDPAYNRSDYFYFEADPQLENAFTFTYDNYAERYNDLEFEFGFQAGAGSGSYVDFEVNCGDVSLTPPPSYTPEEGLDKAATALYFFAPILASNNYSSKTDGTTEVVQSYCGSGEQEVSTFYGNDYTLTTTTRYRCSFLGDEGYENGVLKQYSYSDSNETLIVENYSVALNADDQVRYGVESFDMNASFSTSPINSNDFLVNGTMTVDGVKYSMKDLGMGVYTSGQIYFKAGKIYFDGIGYYPIGGLEFVSDADGLYYGISGTKK